jgi:monoamine oxidase
MNSPHPSHVLIIGAGAAGLMAGCELVRAGTRVTILEARDRCGGRICPLPSGEFGYEAEGGAEFVHGEAPVTGALARKAGLSLLPVAGARWEVEKGVWSRDKPPPHEAELRQALAELRDDLPVAEFLETRFGGRDYEELRQSILQTVEGYDAADPHRASTLALRDEWMAEGIERARRIVEGYGALIEFLAAEFRRCGGAIQLGVAVTAIEAAAMEARGGRIAVRAAGGRRFEGDAAILTVPLPLLGEIELPSPAREKATLAETDIGFGNVAKILLRFGTRWWAEHDGRDLADLSFVFSDAAIPTWWTQYPAGHPVLTGWLGGPKADKVGNLTPDELVDRGLASLAEIFARPVEQLRRDLVAARAINWRNDPFARGAYSYATPKTERAKARLRQPDGSNVFFCGEAFYVGRNVATVEAALASGQETARVILGVGES